MVNKVLCVCVMLTIPRGPRTEPRPQLHFGEFSAAKTPLVATMHRTNGLSD